MQVGHGSFADGFAGSIAGALVVDSAAGEGSMGPVHLYLGAWVAGGLLLGASLLLDGRERPAPSTPLQAEGDEPQVQPRADVLTPPSTGSRVFRLCSLGLIGFGLCGLTAKGLGFDLWPWTLVWALTAGLLLLGLGYRLSRSSPL